MTDELVEPSVDHESISEVGGDRFGIEQIALEPGCYQAVGDESVRRRRLLSHGKPPR